MNENSALSAYSAAQKDTYARNGGKIDLRCQSFGNEIGDFAKLVRPGDGHARAERGENERQNDERQARTHIACGMIDRARDVRVAFLIFHRFPSFAYASSD